MNNTNFNMAVCGTSGAGKTGLIQPLIRSVLDSGGFARVFDMGDGYKSLCENMGAYTSMAIPSSLTRSPTCWMMLTSTCQQNVYAIRCLSWPVRTATSMKSMKACFCRQCRRPWLSKRNHARVDDVVQFYRTRRTAMNMLIPQQSGAVWTR